MLCGKTFAPHVGSGKLTDNVFLLVSFTADSNAFTTSTISPSLKLSLRLLQLAHPPTHTHTDWACTTCSNFGFLFLILFYKAYSVHVHECTHLCAHTHTTHTHTHTHIVIHMAKNKTMQHDVLRRCETMLSQFFQPS